MTPTMKLRWFAPARPAVTAEGVRAYATAYGLSILQAKRALEGPPVAPVLQQWWDAEGWEHEDYVKAGGEWREIELEIGG